MPSLKKVLIIAYYFPPTGGGGVQRVLKFTKYLPKFGWKPIVLTVRDPLGEVIDKSLLTAIPAETDIHYTKCWTPEKFYKKLDSLYSLTKKWATLTKGTGTRPLESIANQSKEIKNDSNLPRRLFPRGFRVTINSWLFLPDDKIFWLPFAFKEVKKIIETDKIDAIYSTSAPFTSHLIAYLIKRRTRKPWVADFRDPWVQNPYLHFPTKLHRAIALCLERLVIKNADKVINVSKNLSNISASGHSAIPRSKFETITNGFDEDDFEDLSPSYPPKFRIAYTGSFYGLHKPDVFFQSVAELLNEKPELKEQIELVFVGASWREIQSLALKHNVEKQTTTHAYLPHREALQNMVNAHSLLLVTKSKITVTLKVFEYIGARRPILALVPPDGAAAEIIRETKSGIIIPPHDTDAIKESIYEMFMRWREENLHINHDESRVQSYTRKELTRRLASILDSLAEA